MGEAIMPPPGGWMVYMHPPAGTKWPDTMAFFRPLVDNGIPVLKHGALHLLGWDAYHFIFNTPPHPTPLHIHPRRAHGPAAQAADVAGH